MRFSEANGQEERLIRSGKLSERFDGALGDPAILVSLIVYIRFFSGVLLALSHGVFGQHVGDVSVVGHGVCPGDRVKGAFFGMKDFAQSDDVVSTVFEELGKGDGVGEPFAEVCLEVVHTRVIGTKAGEQGGARGTAYRLLGVGPVEGDATGGKGIDVWRMCQRVAVAAEVGPKVVDEDEENIRFFLRRL